MNAKPSRGFTLSEVIFVTGLLSLILVLVFRTSTQVLPAQLQLRSKVERLRAASTALTRLSRELRSSALRHWPIGNWSQYTPDLQSGNGPLMLVKNEAPLGAASGTVIAYWLDPTEATIRRTSYQSTGFLFGVPSTYQLSPGEAANGRVLAREIESFVLHHSVENEAAFIDIQIQVKGVKGKLSSRVRTLPSPGL